MKNKFVSEHKHIWDICRGKLYRFDRSVCSKIQINRCLKGLHMHHSEISGLILCNIQYTCYRHTKDSQGASRGTLKHMLSSVQHAKINKYMIHHSFPQLSPVTQTLASPRSVTVMYIIHTCAKKKIRKCTVIRSFPRAFMHVDFILYITHDRQM